ncbi:hypothetical protein M422DRAFT_269063 [Sphaerobolus stellatus SS14]|uniref:DUF6535 domain-containing protein n=1 Tax=Sphaerobolus stellatus (strain SS14) TaxID=990650 RepID=A0A0C9TIW1_SPHS4|nr:hypothetical protein M422DRAFT_269063 [Sphaerobolus stellatus SS14]
MSPNGGAIQASSEVDAFWINTLFQTMLGLQSSLKEIVRILHDSDFFSSTLTDTQSVSGLSITGLQNKLTRSSWTSIMAIWMPYLFLPAFFPPSAQHSLILINATLDMNATHFSYNELLPGEPPNSPIRASQSLGYLSLSLSLLAAFGAVLAKRWLSHFKTSRFGHGSIKERVTLRHRRRSGIETWRLPLLLDMLPVMLQFSLIFF